MDQEKDRVERALVEVSIKLRETSSKDSDGDVCIEDYMPRKRMKSAGLRGVSGKGEMGQFAENMKETDMARVALERKKLIFDREKHASKI